MDEMTLRDIQTVSLEILKDVHMFCIAHNINYTLFGGTMIGAIRHKGFIPWDDDIDIAMPRPDYERFLTEYQSKNGYRLIKSGDENCYLAFSRVCEMDKTRVINDTMPWTSESTGVWIDIFPLDAAPDGALEIDKRIERMKKLWLRTCYARSAKSHFSTAHGLVKKAKLLVKKICYNNSAFSLTKLLRSYIDECRALKWGSTNHFCNFSYMWYGRKEYIEQKDFSSVVVVPFEQYEFCICNGYDHLMRTKYGDYMQLPPIEKRVSNHELCKYYWK